MSKRLKENKEKKKFVFRFLYEGKTKILAYFLIGILAIFVFVSVAINYLGQGENNGKIPNDGLIKNYCTEESRKAEVCIAVYDPVCGWFNSSIKCVRYPCAETYSNSCFACMDEKVEYWTKGECP
ncbi:MAG: hypothetical protein NZ903_01695 [Candidatus Micrarchaeota archaeon]|nr:hypothetical protein [Candidatus Micrarchaeota archaeon]